jgi:DNA repair photolyase
VSRARQFPANARSILTRTGGYLSGFTHTLQPYRGCEFSCVYCYVRQMTVARTSPDKLPWSEWIAPKTNAPELLQREGERGRLAGARIFCSSSTDPYTPLERKLRLTRGCLEVMADHPPDALIVQTRNPLVVRDSDLLARIPRVGVSMTVTTDDESVRRALEPDSPSTERRIAALAELRAAGIRVQATLSPLLPGDLERLAERLEPAADRVLIDDFFRGDGAGGSRSKSALARLEDLGFSDWAKPGYADSALGVFRERFGEARVADSQVGFNTLDWLEPDRG